MATKGKSTSGKSQLPKELEALFAKGLEALSGGKAEEAAKTFHDLEARAAEAGHVGLERTSKGYSAAAKARAAKPAKGGAGDPVLDLQVQLNLGASEAALERADKALKAHGGEASLHYLKATALAQLGRFEESSQSLSKAVEIDRDMLWVFFLEPDFAKARTQASFSVFESMV